MMRRALSVLFVFLALIALPGCMKKADFSKGLGRDENVFIGRLAFKRANDVAKEKGVLEQLGIAPDEWGVDRIAVCFDDGGQEKCTVQKEFDVRMARYEANKSPAFVIRTSGRKLALTRIVIYGHGDYGFKFTSPPSVSVPGGGGVHYIGDFVVYLPKDTDSLLRKLPKEFIEKANVPPMPDMPMLELSVRNSLAQTRDAFIQNSKLPEGTVIHERLFPSGTPEYIFVADR